jgi:DNA polymerase-3 subunit alpha
MEGLRERYGDPPPAEAVERMEMELGVIDRMGFNAYFLIVWDFCKWARDHGVVVGPGRGSAAGLDRRLLPVDHRRRPAALRPAVRALPQRRARVDAGHRHRLLRARARARDPLRDREVRPRPVAQIITFGKMFPRAATRDAARVLGHDYGDGRPLAKLIPDPIMGPPPSFDDCLQPARARGEVASDPTPSRSSTSRRGLEGHRPQRVDPRRGGRDRRPPADRHRAAAARRRAARDETATRSTARSRSSR